MVGEGFLRWSTAVVSAVPPLPRWFRFAVAPVALAGAAAAGATHLAPLFPAAAAGDRERPFAGRQGFVRIVNHSARAGDVRIKAIDDAGVARGPVVLALGGRRAVHFNSQHLQSGNPAIGLKGIGPPTAGAENWRLVMASALDIEVLAYLRTADGFLASMHELAPPAAEGGARVAFFNPARNANQVSYLRIINPRSTPASVAIAAVDDEGNASEVVRATVPGGAARTFSAVDLERGHAQLTGVFGPGRGKRRLTVRLDASATATSVAGERLGVMSLLASPTGHLANLSAAPPPPTRGGETAVHPVAYFPAAGGPRQGFLRIVNASSNAAAVAIRAVDAAARPGRGTTLRIASGRTVHLNSDDLERGNARKGLAGGVGTGTPPWRLELSTTAAIEVLPYIRTPDGFVTSMAGIAPVVGSRSSLATFNPGRNAKQASQLHLTNPGSQDAAVAVRGVDDGGQAAGPVRLTLPAGGMRTLAASVLESGDGVAGALGEGAGKWRLTVEAGRPIGVLGLLASPTGHLGNLSSAADRSAEGYFQAHIASSVVQAKCVGCHTADGEARATRLLFRPGEAAANHAAFRRFLGAVADGAARILNKVQGRADHGGGVQLASASADFANLRTYLERLAGEMPGRLPPAATVALFDAVPAPGTEVDASTRSLQLIHADAAEARSYGYGGRCQPTGRTLRRSLRHLSPGRAGTLAAHRIECPLAPMDSYRVWADRIAGGGYQRAELAFTAGADRGPPALTVRDVRTIPRDDVDQLFHAYVLEALSGAIEDPAEQVGAALVIDQIAQRTWLNLRDPDAAFDVVTESVSYVSRDPRGAWSDRLTGLVARPETTGGTGFEPRQRVLVLSHATGATPSAMRFRDAWYAVAAMFAGRGYLVLAPDNWGRGELARDGEPETYLMANRTANNSLDMLGAVLADPRYRRLHLRTAGKADVAVVGYSQGGHTAVALWLATLGGDYPWRLREVHSGGAPHNLYRTLRGALEHVASRCDGNAWCRHVGAEVVVPYAAGRILPGLLAYANIGLTAADVADDSGLRPAFLAGMFGEDRRYDAVKMALQLNSFTNLVGLERFASDETAIHLYHSPFDRLVPVQNTVELATLLAPHFDVDWHSGECASPAYGVLAGLRVGVAHAVCGMEVLDDVLRDLR